MTFIWRRKSGLAEILLAGIAVVFGVWVLMRIYPAGSSLVSVNGRLEATEIDVATKLPGRVGNIFVSEGDFVQADQPLARIKVDALEARRDEARANLQRASNSVNSARAHVTLRECEKVAAQAVVAERESELDSAQRRLKRSEVLAKAQITSAQELDDDRARVRHGEASLRAAQAQAAAAQAAIEAAEAEMVGAKSAAVAAEATLARVEADTNDTELKSPRNGVVQRCIARPGDLLGPGGKVVNLVDLNDLFVTFVVPEKAAKRVVLGGEVRIQVDVPAQRMITAKVASIAFQPNLTLNAGEYGYVSHRSSFRVKAKIPTEVAQRQLRLNRAGLPAVAWLKLNPQSPWPKELELTTNRVERCTAPRS